MMLREELNFKVEGRACSLGIVGEAIRFPLANDSLYVL